MDLGDGNFAWVGCNWGIERLVYELVSISEGDTLSEDWLPGTNGLACAIIDIDKFWSDTV